MDEDIKELNKSCEYAHDSYEEVKKQQIADRFTINALEEKLGKIEEESKELKNEQGQCATI